MADRVAERWDRMSPEERERFRQRLRERCGFDPSAGEDVRDDRLHFSYFHSQIFASVLPCSSTSYSNRAATPFRRFHSGD